MATARRVSFPSAVRRLLASLCKGTFKRHESDLREKIAAMQANASDSQLQDGLHELWRLVRHAPQVRWVGLDDWPSRSAQLPEEDHHSEQAPPSETPSSSEELDRLWRANIDIVARHLPGGAEGLSLVSEYQYTESRCPLFMSSTDVEEEGFLEAVSALLAHISDQSPPLIRRSLAYQAVFGWMQDWSPAQILQAKVRFLQVRVTDGRADLYDYWHLYRLDPSDSGAFDRLLQRLKRASTAQVEALLVALGQDEMDENGWVVNYDDYFPGQGGVGFWHIILAKPKLSRFMLARAGQYYWKHRNELRGKSDTLASYAFTVEAAFEFPRETGPFLPLWAAAAAAADEAREAEGRGHQTNAEERRLLSRAYFNLALILIAASAQGLSRVWNRAEIATYHFPCEFVFEFRLEPSRTVETSPVYCCFVALQALRHNRVNELSRLRPILRAVGWELGASRIGYAKKLEDALGSSLWTRVNEQTRDYLVLAEELVETCEERRLSNYGVVGTVYRQAIEHEWRVEIGAHVLEMKGNDPEWTVREVRRLGLGAMVGALRKETMLRERHFGHLPALRNDEFLRHAGDFCRQFLNVAAHESGLTDNEYLTMRDLLFRRRKLQELLGAVHPP